MLSIIHISSLPTPEQSGIVADKRDAYVQQEMKAKQEAKMRSLEDFAFSLGEDVYKRQALTSANMSSYIRYLCAPVQAA